MDKSASNSPDPPDDEPEPDSGPEDAAPPEPDWHEATLRRLEAWIEERERLIADLERRLGE